MIGWKIVILFLLGILVVFLIGSMLVKPVKTIFSIEAPKRGPLARFVRYMGCAVAMCMKGCRSDEVITHPLEYDNKGKVVKSCHQLIEENGWCDGKTTGTPLCGRDYPIEFTFDEPVKYVGNYSVNRFDVRTYGTCAWDKTGWQTDASCVGDWEEYIPCPCLECMSGPEIIRYGAGRPVGKMLVNNNGCDDVPGSATGAIWIPNTMMGTGPGQCIEGVGAVDWEADQFFKTNDAAAWCNFEQGQTIYIWATDNIALKDECLVNAPPLLKVCCSDLYMFVVPLLCLLSNYRCPQVLICDSYPT